MASPPSPYRPQVERSKALRIGFLIGFAVIVGQLFNVQILSRDYYVSEIAPLLALRSRVTVPPPGDILDRYGEPLAHSSMLQQLVADPLRMQEQAESFTAVSRELATALHQPAPQLLELLERSSRRHYVVLDRWLIPSTVDQVRKLRIEGLSFVPQWQRRYPQGRMAAQLLGGRNPDHEPISGLEYRWRLILDSLPGSHQESPDGSSLTALEQAGGVPPQAGRNLVLTLQTDLQHQVEVEMDRLWGKESPKWAMCVVMDPNNGDILAMSSRPDYDPNAYVQGKPAPGCKWSAVSPQATKNIPVEVAVEPGSTFKILLTAAALDQGYVTPSSTFNCSGTMSFGSQQKISCWGKYAAQGHGPLDVSGMLAQSCNICAAQIALRMGATAYRAFLDRCGIGHDPQAGFPAEAFGQLQRLSTIRPGDLANMGFGQNVSCSGLQLTAIISGLVNGGRSVQPHIVSQVLNEDKTVFWQFQPPPSVQLCKPQTSATLRKMLWNVVENGTGKPAKIPDCAVGAKTGTAQEWDEVTHQHRKNRFMVSFVLVAPIDHPRYVIYVACNEPQVGKHGSDVAGPVAKRIAEFALRHLNQPMLVTPPAAGQPRPAGRVTPTHSTAPVPR